MFDFLDKIPTGWRFYITDWLSWHLKTLFRGLSHLLKIIAYNPLDTQGKDKKHGKRHNQN